MKYFYKMPMYIIGVLFLVLLRIIRPFILIRISGLLSFRIGHLCANTEIYLCELKAGINKPKGLFIDIFYLISPISNYQLTKMWSRILRIYPTWFLYPIYRINSIFPGGNQHLIPMGEVTNNMGRDVFNLYDEYNPHLKFTNDEISFGEAELRCMGIPSGAKFICLNVRDSEYLNSHIPKDWSYHDYRDSDIDNYNLIVNELANRGYYVVRMGAKVKKKLNITHPLVLDYATNGMRTDFMDIYLGSKCYFAISTGSGWDGVPEIFRRPIVYVNFSPVGMLLTFRSLTISIFKHYYSVNLNRRLSLNEIFENNLGFLVESKCYQQKQVQLVENSPEEIKDVVFEMIEILEHKKIENYEESKISEKFWNIMKQGIKNNPIKYHGKIKSYIGSSFLKNNQYLIN